MIPEDATVDFMGDLVMTTRKWLAAGMCAFVAGLGVSTVRAQEIPSPYPPGYNPYLQMINPRGSVTQNYFSLVYPQLRIQDNFMQLQQQSIDTRRGLVKLRNPVAETSKKVGFNTHQKFFDNNTTRFGINNTTNTNIRPPVTNESLLRMYRQQP